MLPSIEKRPFTHVYRLQELTPQANGHFSLVRQSLKQFLSTEFSEYRAKLEEYREQVDDDGTRLDPEGVQVREVDKIQAFLSRFVTHPHHFVLNASFESGETSILHIQDQTFIGAAIGTQVEGINMYLSKTTSHRRIPVKTIRFVPMTISVPAFKERFFNLSRYGFTLIQYPDSVSGLLTGRNDDGVRQPFLEFAHFMTKETFSIMFSALDNLQLSLWDLDEKRRETEQLPQTSYEDIDEDRIQPDRRVSRGKNQERDGKSWKKRKQGKKR
jgi:hypothetical protein